MMEDIKRVVDRIVKQLDGSGVPPVSPGLAAFVAKTVILEDCDHFQLDKELTEQDVDELVQRSVEKLQLVDNPQMETVKMQVEFDAVFMETEDAIDQQHGQKKLKLNALKSQIVNADIGQASSEFEAINAVYRQVFHFLVCDVDGDQSKDRSVEREIAAALESVFPKIGVKSFVAMEYEDKQIQLSELAHIVMGIRLFNRRIGKGGASIKDIPSLIRRSANSLLSMLVDEKDQVDKLVQDYSMTLVFAHKYGEGGPDPEKIERWKQELSNRRQYLAFMTSLDEDCIHALNNVNKLEDKLEEIMSILQDLVGARTSVPKDQVYPKFHVVSEIWHELQQELEIIESRHVIWATLQEFRKCCSFTLDPSWVNCARSDSISSSANNKTNNNESKLQDDEDQEREMQKESKIPETKEEEGKQEEGRRRESKQGDVPIVLTPENSPDFMNLPLEFQGYCPTTLAARNGLLLPGDPTLGVVSYRDTYQVFASKEAMNAFLRNPEAIIADVLKVAKMSPELIHICQLEGYFPNMDGFVRGGRKSGASSSLNAAHKPLLVDASTETPTHFIESHIDPSYEWNEWALRRRTLQLVNLRNARTSSTQTVKSHFRRENETQVYLPKQQATQTGIQKGTNPPRRHQYIVGLRGNTTKFVKNFNATNAHILDKANSFKKNGSFNGNASVASSSPSSSFNGKPQAQQHRASICSKPTFDQTKTTVVNMTFDL